MKNLIVAILLLSPAFVHADVLPTRSLEPILRVYDNTLYVTDKRGNNWAIETTCEVEITDIKEFTVRGNVLRAGKVVKLNKEKRCEIETIQAA